MKPTIRLGLVGATGRMGMAVQSCLSIHDFVLSQAWSKVPADANQLRLTGKPASGKPASGKPASGKPASDRPIDVIIDFSTPDATLYWAKVASKNRWPMVVGTTGLDKASMQALKSFAKSIPLFFSANMSIGLNCMAHAARMIRSRIPENVDIEIIEAHHRHKKDSPSGTAKYLADQVQCKNIHSLRVGEVIGEHEIVMAYGHEVITLKHQALDRRLFAEGALQVARWLIKQKSGFYSMADYLEIK